MGYIRFILSISVIIAHLGPQPRFLESLLWWHGSVWLFFCISGYLMTLLMNEVYSDRALVFLVNRALRIFPAYWIVLILTLLGFAYFGEQPHMHWNMVYPNAKELLMNIFMIIPAESIYSAPVSVAWSLSVELFYYILISMGLFANRVRTLIILCGAIVGDIIVHPDYNDLRWALIPFSLGAALYWLGLRVRRDRGFSALLGELSYPIYLIHFPLGAFIGTFLGTYPSWRLFFYSLIPTIVCAWLLNQVCDRPIENLRKKLRG